MRLIGHLRRFGLPTLRQLSGETLLKAVEGCAPSEQESQLAEILLLRYGTRILENREVRKALVDSLSAGEGLNLSRVVGLSGASHVERSQRLAAYFASYNHEKSKLLADFLNLPSSYYQPISVDERTALELVEVEPGEEVRLKSFLHGYQKQVKDEIAGLLKKDAIRFMVQMPTGAGKTFTALEAVVDLMRAPRTTFFVVWLVDSNELAEQAFESFRSLWKLKGDRPLVVGRLFNKFCPKFEQCREGGVIFAAFDKLNSILSDKRHPDRIHVSDLLARTRLLVVDEAHGAVARTYRGCIDAFTSYESHRVVGLTATPGRPDAVETEELSDVFSRNLVCIKARDGAVLEDPINFLQQEGYLARLECELLETGVTIHDANEQRICRKLAGNADRNKRIVDQIELAHQAEESTVVFGCTLDHVFALKVMCAKRLIPCEIVVGETAQSDRLTVLRRFRDREFFILLNLDILSAGIDLPKMQKLILTRPIGSPVLYSQVLGRALRGPKNGGNAVNKIVNLRDNLQNFPSANLLYTNYWEDWVRH